MRLSLRDLVRRRRGAGADPLPGRTVRLPPPERHGWLLGLSAPWVEADRFRHDLLALVPNRRGEEGRRLADALRRRQLSTPVRWRGEVVAARDEAGAALEKVAAALARVGRRGGGPGEAAALLRGVPRAEARLELVARGGAIDRDAARCWDVGRTTYLLRLGVAAGHLDAGAAMVEIAQQAQRLPAVQGWRHYAGALDRAARFVDPAGRDVPTTADELLEPGGPWHAHPWPGTGTVPL